jgi:PKD repeat protein
MRYRIYLLFLLIYSWMSSSVIAQQSMNNNDFFQCGTDLQMARVFAQHPELKIAFENHLQQVEIEDLNNQRSATRTAASTIYTIPVVFHIIHDNGPENISDAQIQDAMRILNEDFRKLNSDTTAVATAFKPLVADCEIEFRLANIDPYGTCTNGIDRIASSQTYIGDDGSKLNPWPNTMYLNIWVVRAINFGAAGYAYLPGTAPSAAVDGIVILSNYVGSIGTGNPSTAKVLTHEVGHFLDLLHVWGWTNQPGVSCGDDGVSDTPITEGWTSCNLTTNAVCTPGVAENVQNYMEYAYCSHMFTPGQALRMRNTLNSIFASRYSLSTSTNLTATGVNNNPPAICAPKANFRPGPAQVCANIPVTFTDQSWNGTPTSWLWSFPGSSTNSSTSQNPIVTYPTPGTYNVSLTASNTAGSTTITYPVTVLPSPQYTASFYSESFENISTLSSDWTLVVSTNNNWSRITSTAYSGTACMKYDNQISSAGQLVELISPTIDIGIIKATSFTFRLAYAQRGNSNLDRLRVLISYDCGLTWIPRYTRSGATLSTAPNNLFNFIPTLTEWRLVTVPLTNVINSSNTLRFKFEFLSDGGNHIYIDDINILAPAGISNPNIPVQRFSLFPNPAQENTQVVFQLQEQEQVTMQITDVTGREVLLVFKGNLAAGEHTYTINVAGLSKGIYFVRLQSPEGALTQKLFVE